MGELVLDFYNDRDHYSDGDIENEILDIVTQYGEFPPEELIRDYTMAYHLSPIRENILNWYPFPGECRILEIGSGCGGITGLLCRKAGQVVSVELSKRRATINYERHKAYDNLKIIVANFNDLCLEEKFDYVVLNGVFEYAASFTKTEHPYGDFLDFAASYLKEDGKLLIAIENRLGIKYFNGAKEDHTNCYFSGLDHYKGVETVKTFSKGEWKELLEERGLPYFRFYYPYPDYKFPQEIFSQDAMSNMRYGKPYINLERERLWLFDEYQLLNTLGREGIADHFANSFLIEAARQDVVRQKVYYAKLNMDRRKRFRIGTRILQEEGEMYVEKFPLTDRAWAHIRATGEKIEEKDGRIMTLPAKETADGIRYEFLKQKTLQKVLMEHLKANELEQAVRLVQDVVSAYLENFVVVRTKEYPNERFQEYFGECILDEEEDCIEGANIDLVLENVFQKEGRYVIIDSEWRPRCLVPVKFIVWRMMIDWKNTVTSAGATELYIRICETYRISTAQARQFQSWNDHFVAEYAGNRQLMRWFQDAQCISLNGLWMEKRKRSHLCTSLYVDTGEGFSEDRKIYREVPIADGEFQVEFSLEGYEKIKNLRWDPVENQYCVITRLELPEEFLPSRKVGEEWEILEGDPKIELAPKQKAAARKVKISGHIQFMETEEAIARLSGRIPESKQEKIAKLRHRIRCWL